MAKAPTALAKNTASSESLTMSGKSYREKREMNI